jgi:hypothetical protein
MRNRCIVMGGLCALIGCADALPDTDANPRSAVRAGP